MTEEEWSGCAYNNDKTWANNKKLIIKSFKGTGIYPRAEGRQRRVSSWKTVCARVKKCRFVLFLCVMEFPKSHSYGGQKIVALQFDIE